MSCPHFVIVGAGFAGAVLARELAEGCDCRITIHEMRDHVGGNCHTERDPATQVMVHKYGPHIFNTNREDVWNYVNRFARFRPYVNRVKARIDRGIFSFPINLHTINQFFGQVFDPGEARAFIATQGDSSIGEPANFEEQALKMLGRELYEAFFRGYTTKQWGCDPRELPASILKRLPVRFSYNDSYYDKIFQGIPEEGYTELVWRLLDHERIVTELETPFNSRARPACDRLFYTGAVDAFYGYEKGRLGYRTVTFERVETRGDYQGNAVINYPGLDFPYTRIHEHKHFAPWERHERTVAFREFSKETGDGDIPYYPKRLGGDLRLLKEYLERARTELATSFLGRLGTYRYLNMDEVIAESLDFAAETLACLSRGELPPTFATHSL